MSYPAPRRLRPAALAFIAAGLAMMATWILFTAAHGPTSYDLDRTVLGGSTLSWGFLLGVVPNLLIITGLLLLFPVLARDARRLARIGYVIALLGLTASTALDLYYRALGPPFFLPVTGIGLILTALGSRGNLRLPAVSPNLLLFAGAFMVIGIVLMLVPLEVSDRYGGYRVAGIFAYLLPGFCWAALGASLWRAKSRLP